MLTKVASIISELVGKSGLVQKQLVYDLRLTGVKRRQLAMRYYTEIIR